MPILFHQNMRTFGGGSAPRNAVYAARFAAINAALPGNIVAAGFTEITNPNPPLRLRLAVLSQVLDPAINQLLVMEVGTSALGMTEYIGISWNAALINVQAAGQVTYNNLNRRWQGNAVPAPFPSQVIRAPNLDYNALDSRGPAFIAGLVPGGAIIIMYMHNMYNLGDRSAGMTGLRMCAADIREALGGVYAAAPVYLGGDLNVYPHDLANGRGTQLYYRALIVGGLPVNTTNANPYDFWLVTDNAIPFANAQVYPQSRVALASDHAGIGLTL